MNESFSVSLSSFGDPFTGLNWFGQSGKVGKAWRAREDLVFVYRNKKARAADSCRSLGKQRTQIATRMVGHCRHWKTIPKRRAFAILCMAESRGLCITYLLNPKQAPSRIDFLPKRPLLQQLLLPPAAYCSGPPSDRPLGA